VGHFDVFCDVRVDFHFLGPFKELFNSDKVTGYGKGREEFRLEEGLVAKDIFPGRVSMRVFERSRLCFSFPEILKVRQDN